MQINKYDIEYFQTNSENKPIFIFVNHKTAVLCWAKIGREAENISEVITFDSHRDFMNGFIIGKNPPTKESCFGSKPGQHFNLSLTKGAAI